MKILYIASNPDEASTLQIEKEANLLRETLDDVETSEPIDLRIYSSLDVDTLPQVIIRAAPDILHFAAHGEGDSIVLAHSERGYAAFDGDMLADLLLALRVRPKLILINACTSAAMASKLARAADFTIGTDAPISNVGARTMAATLYQRLADAASIHEAHVAAETMLKWADNGEVGTRLYSELAVELAQRTRIADPLRILACFPAVEAWLDKRRKRPRDDFDPELPVVEFGVAGCPATVRQLQLLTDDETVRPRKGESLADARSWMIETTPTKGEIWVSPAYFYYGSMQWYASVTTSDLKILATSANTVEALGRYYFDEAWRGALPPGIEAVVRESMLALERNDGSRRGRNPAPKVKIAHP